MNAIVSSITEFISLCSLFGLLVTDWRFKCVRFMSIVSTCKIFARRASVRYLLSAKEKKNNDAYRKT